MSARGKAQERSSRPRAIARARQVNDPIREDRGGERGQLSAAPRISLAVQYAVSRARLPAPATLRRWAGAAAETDARVTLRFVGRREGRALNARYRGKPHATNVLAFVYDESPRIEGDVVLCTPVLREEARAQQKPLADHCAHLVVHGMLHLQGYDHDTDRAARAMEARESAILAAIGVPDPWAPAVARARLDR
jgi:probable rRNA maturation factor